MRCINKVQHMCNERKALASKLHLWRSQRQGTSVHTPRAEYLGETVQSPDAFGLDILDVGVIQHQLCFVIGQPRHAVDDGLAEIHVDNFSRRRHFPNDTECESAARVSIESVGSTATHR